MLLFGLAVLSLMWPFLFTTGSPDDDPRRWWLLVAFVLFAGAFVAWERHYEGRGKQPLIRFALFRISSFRNGTLLIAAYFTALPALFLLTTLFLQTGVGLAPVYAGMVTIGFALASAVFSWIGGNLVGTYGRPVVVWGLVGVLACVVGLAAAALFVPAAVGGVGDGRCHGDRRHRRRPRDVTEPDADARTTSRSSRAASPARSASSVSGSAHPSARRSHCRCSTRRSTARAASAPDIVVYHDAYAYGMTAVAIFIALAFLISIVDLSSRRRKKRPARA